MSKRRVYPPANVLLDVFMHDSVSGSLLWKNHSKRTRRMGTVAGFLKKNGYWVVGLKGEYWLVHLIIWVMHYGNEIPDDKMIDHINRNKADNRIENLRLVSMSHNTINSLKVDLAEGVYHAGKLYPFRPYRASIKINGKRVDLGWFASREGGCDGLQRSCSK